MCLNLILSDALKKKKTFETLFAMMSQNWVRPSKQERKQYYKAR